MKKLGFNNRMWLVIGLTVVLTLLTRHVITGDEVKSRGEAMHVISQHGHVECEGEYLLFSHGEEIQGYTPRLLQSLAIMSEVAEVHIMN
jgi:hypothetical protein